MRHKVKISIIIPVYNGSKYIHEAIDSALKQTYDNVEIIVINDGSTDKTAEIVKSYGNKIKYYEKENGGVSSALNLGIQKMSGQYFSWLSHDDTYLPDKLEKQMDYLYKNDLIDEKVILYTNYYLINEKSKITGNNINDHNELNNKPEYSLLRGAINGLSLLIPKCAFDEHGVFDENLRCAQDYLLWHKMFRTYKPIHIPLSLVCTRLHPRQVTNTSPRVITEGNQVWKMMIDSLSKDDKERLEESEYLFYTNMAEFLKSTPYNETQEYCEDKVEEIKNNFNKNVDTILVSVIIPFFNRIKDVEKAIQTVLNQTHKNYEIILINDNSTDNIEEIRKIVKNIDRITLINLDKNSGPANARNEGIKIAKGEYIAFLDSDDEYLPEKITKQLKEMLITNAVMSHTSYIRKMSGEEIVVNSGVDTGNIKRNLIYNCKIATPTVMLKKSYIDINKLLFNPDLRIGEDVCYWLSILKNKSLVGINEPLTIVNTSKTNSAYDIEKQIIGTKSILKFLLNDEYYNIYDDEIAIVARNYYNLLNINSFKSKSLKLKYQQVKHSIKSMGVIQTSKKIYSKILNRIKT